MANFPQGNHLLNIGRHCCIIRSGDLHFIRVLPYIPLKLAQCFVLQITWLDDRGLVLTEGVRTVQELMEDGKRYVTISILKFVATTQHHGRSFTCQAQNSANRQPKSVSTK